MAAARAGHTATLLPNGQVLVVGDMSDGSALLFGELYDPVADRWTRTLPMNRPLLGHTATLLPDGGVLLLTGGFATRYAPASDSFLPTATLSVPRSGHFAAPLPNGRVLVGGGTGFGGVLRCELYDPDTNGWQAAADLPADFFFGLSLDIKHFLQYSF